MKNNAQRLGYITLFLLFIGEQTYTQVVPHKIPIIVITDLYHPYQDPGDNLDLIMGFGLQDVDLKAILLDITDAFRKPIADFPSLWKDPYGPREAGIIPIEQLNYIFNKKVPYAIGPLYPMTSEEDKMESLPQYQQQAIYLLRNILKESKEPVEILSFGSARILAVAYNRYPKLLKKKIHKIHLSAGTASNHYELGSDKGANAILGGEWNVALDVFAFTRILKSDLPVALYPCAGKDGAFVKDVNNTYWQLTDMKFVSKMNPQLQRYLDFAFNRKLQYDFLRAMEPDYPVNIDVNRYPQPFHVWESALWLKTTNKIIVCTKSGEFKIEKDEKFYHGNRLVKDELRPCYFYGILNSGRFQFSYCKKNNYNKEIYYRENPDENEKALQKIIPELFESFLSK